MAAAVAADKGREWWGKIRNVAGFEELPEEEPAQASLLNQFSEVTTLNKTQVIPSSPLSLVTNSSLSIPPRVSPPSIPHRISGPTTPPDGIGIGINLRNWSVVFKKKHETHTHAILLTLVCPAENLWVFDLTRPRVVLRFLRESSLPFWTTSAVGPI